MKRKNSLPLICLLAFSLSGCDLFSTRGSASRVTGDGATYLTKDVKVYRDNTGVDKEIGIRFYDKTPNIPYIEISAYFKEFFKTEVTKKINGDVYTYRHPNGDYIAFDVESDTMYIFGGDSFADHPDMQANTSKWFLSAKNAIITDSTLRSISLKSYGIDIHYENSEAYAPLSLLSSFSAGTSLVSAAYNGESIYFCDYYGSLVGETRDPRYFKDTYFSVLGDLSAKRPQDLIDYSYNQLCLMFDNDRGYTTQLLFGDNNLVTIGLNGLLEMYYPSIKEHLLSDDKATYYQGYQELFMGLWDGGHTVSLMTTLLDNPYFDGNDYQGLADAVAAARENPELNELVETFRNEYNYSWDSATYNDALSQAFGDETKQGYFYYHFDEEHTTAYIGFDSFFVDYSGWDDYYSGKAEAPYDTYYHVLSSLNAALEDGATNVVLDTTCNGGGDTGSMTAIVGLFDGAKASQILINTLSKTLIKTNYDMDVDLDGDYDEEDVAAAARFQNFNVGVLSSKNCFSCGNNFASLMKMKGYKIIGQRTGGGSCAIAYEFTADGLPYVRSSHYMLGCNPDGSNIDDGVAPDFNVAEEVGRALGTGTLSYQEAAPYLYDVELIANYLESAYAE